MYRALVSRQTAQAVRPRRASPLQVRHNTSASSAANKAGDTAKLAQQKAADALGSAQKVAGKGFEQLKSVSGKVGESAGNLLGGTLAFRLRPVIGKS